MQRTDVKLQSSARNKLESHRGQMALQVKREANNR